MIPFHHIQTHSTELNRPPQLHWVGLLDKRGLKPVAKALSVFEYGAG